MSFPGGSGMMSIFTCHRRCDHGHHGRRHHGNVPVCTKELYNSNDDPRRNQRSFGAGAPTLHSCFRVVGVNRARRRLRRTVILRFHSILVTIVISIALNQYIIAFGNNSDRYCHTISTTNVIDPPATSSILPVVTALVSINRQSHQRHIDRMFATDAGSGNQLGPRQASVLQARSKIESDHDYSYGNNSNNKNDSAPNSTGTVDETIEQQKKYWVVLIDDEEDLRLAVSNFLCDKGYHVSAYSDAPTFLEFCNDIDQRREQQKQQRIEKLMQKKSQSDANNDSYDSNVDDNKATRFPDLIISDVRMPGGPNGVELVKAVRSHPSVELRTIPIVMLTAKALAQDRVEGYKAGADFYLPKPFSPDELVSIINNMISRKEQRRKAAAAAAAASNRDDGGSDNRDLITTAHIPDLLELKQELEDIKSIMEQNAERVVQKTDVYLTERQREVLELVCNGYTNIEIAEQCGVTSLTIYRIIKKLYSLTETQTRTQLVRWAILTGYLSR